VRQHWQDFRIQHRYLNPDKRLGIVAVGYLVLITAAESITTLVDPLWGMILHGAVLAALLIHGSLLHRETHRRFVVLLSLAPLIRLLSLSIPLSKLGLPLIYWYMVIGILLFMAAFIAGYITGLRGQRIGWSWRSWPVQLLIGCMGFGLGYVEYLILKPGPLGAYLTWLDVLTAAFILLVFTGILEEYIFRGLMQSASMQIMGSFGLIYVGVLFAVLHLGYHSVPDLVFVLFAGLMFGFLVWKTHSLIGASLAHGIANISLYVVFPLMINAGALPVASGESQPAQIPTPSDLTTMELDTTTTALSSLPPGDALVDNGDPGFVFTGINLWLDSTAGHGGSFLWTYANSSVPEVVVTWLPPLRGCGRYRVEAYVPVGAGLTETAQYRIRHRVGTDLVNISQAAFNGKWAPLGSFDFQAGSDSYVQLSNETGEDPKLLRWVGFDALRWVFLEPCSMGAENYRR
jgi:membrane protease YdiL (CAAX protease family)